MLVFLLVAAVAEVLLAGYGLVLTPAAANGEGLIALAAVVVAQLACVTAAGWGPVSLRRAPAGTVTVGARIGVITGGLYAALIVGEYVIPMITSASYSDFTIGGYVIVAVLVGAACLAGTWGARRSSTLHGGVTAAVWAAITEYLVWYPSVLITYYAFYGSTAQERWLRAEGVYEDMQGSGTTDIKIFAIQDQYGAGFFHLVAGVILALLFGTGAAALTIRIRRVRARTAPTGGTT